MQDFLAPPVPLTRILFSKTVKASSPSIPKTPTRPPHPGVKKAPCQRWPVLTSRSPNCAAPCRSFWPATPSPPRLSLVPTAPPPSTLPSPPQQLCDSFRKPDSSAYSCHDQQPQMSRQPAKTLDSDALQRPAAATSSPPASVSATGATLSRGERGEAEPSRGEAEEEPRSREAEEPYPQSRCCASPRRQQLCASLRCESNTRASVYATCVTVEQARPARSLRRHLCVCPICVVIQTWKYQGQ